MIAAIMQISQVETQDIGSASGPAREMSRNTRNLSSLSSAAKLKRLKPPVSFGPGRLVINVRHQPRESGIVIIVYGPFTSYASYCCIHKDRSYE